MDGMAQSPAHAKPARKNHLWVLFAIAFPAAVEVWASWVGVGSRSGFPVIRLPFGGPAFSTGFSLAVGMEAYWGYALYVWLAAGAGPRSRKFAMQSAIGAFMLSLLGQIAYHLMLAEHVAATPVIVVVFVAALPVTLLALVAFLIHLMHADGRDAEESARRAALEAERTASEDAAADERTALRAELDTAREASRAELDALRAELETAVSARAEVEQRAAEALAKVEVLTRKLARISGRKPARKSPPKKTATSTPEATASSPPEVQVPEDVDTQAAALEILAQEPDISGSALGRRLGKSERYGCMLKNQLTGSVAGPDSGSA